MERAKDMLVGFGFLSLALCIKSIYSGEHTALLAFVLVFTIVVGPPIVSYKWKNNKLKQTVY